MRGITNRSGKFAKWCEWCSSFEGGELEPELVVRKFRTTTQHGAILDELKKFKDRQLSPAEEDYMVNSLSCHQVVAKYSLSIL